MTQQKSSRLYNVFKLIFKVGFSLLALYYVSTKIDLVSLFHSVRNISLPLIFVAAILLVISILLAAFRLNTLFKAMPLHVSTQANFKMYWLGLFYNLFLPGGVGGDGYKIFLINRYHKKPVKSLVGVVLSDRLSGLAVIVIYLLMLTYSLHLNYPLINWVALLIPVVLFGYWLFLYLFNRTLILKFWKVIGWSLLSQGVQIIVAFIILYAIGDSFNHEGMKYMFLFLLSSIMASVPISLGGIGLRELTFLHGAAFLHLNVEHAVALSVIYYLISLSIALPGVVFTFNTNKILEGEESLLTDEEAENEF